MKKIKNSLWGLTYGPPVTPICRGLKQNVFEIWIQS